MSHVWGKVAESCALVKHDIAHTHNGIGDVGVGKFYKQASVLVDAVERCRPVGLDAGHQKIGMAIFRRFPKHGLDVYAAAGGVGTLAVHVKDLQREGVIL